MQAAAGSPLYTTTSVADAPVVTPHASLVVSNGTVTEKSKFPVRLANATTCALSVCAKAYNLSVTNGVRHVGSQPQTISGVRRII